MECAERGLIDAPWLRFGDADGMLRAIEEIGAREGLGALLAEGSRPPPRSSARAPRPFAPHVKGLELPGLRAAHAAGDGARARGQRARRRPQPLGRVRGRPLRPHDRLPAARPHVAAAIGTEDRAAVMDSLILCKFLRGVFDEPFPSGRGC
jgi:aldehyde:ferredoxin oxidoreductase